MHYFRMFFSPSSIHSFNNKQHRAEEKKLALKKSSNNEVFEHIQKELAAEAEAENFQSRNNDYFKSTPTKLDISIKKLRQKYKWFKKEVQPIRY